MPGWVTSPVSRPWDRHSQNKPPKCCPEGCGFLGSASIQLAPEDKQGPSGSRTKQGEVTCNGGEGLARVGRREGWKGLARVRPVCVGAREADKGLECLTEAGGLDPRRGVWCKPQPRPRPTTCCAGGMKSPWLLPRKVTGCAWGDSLRSLFGFIGSRGRGPNPGRGSRKTPREPWPQMAPGQGGVSRH